MAPLDWDRLKSLDAEQMDEAEVDNLYQELVTVKADKEDDVEKLRTMFTVCQAVLQVKGNQVDAAMEEAMEALRQRTQEQDQHSAEREEQLKVEISRLRMQLDEIRGTPSGDDTSKTASVELLTRATRLESENADLKRQLKDLEEVGIGMIEDKKRTEALETRLQKQDKELKELRSEAERMREDINDYQRQLETQRETITIRGSEDVDVQKKLRAKNQELLQLLDETNNLSEANMAYEQEIMRLKRSLEESIVQMDKTTDRFSDLQKALFESDQALEALHRENTELREQMDGMIKSGVLPTGGIGASGKSIVENEILAAVEKKIDEWKGLLLNKDKEILVLKQQIDVQQNEIQQYSLDADRVNVVALSKAVEEKEAQLRMLTDELSKATDEIEQNADLMEDLRSQLNVGGSVSDTQKRRMFDFQTKLKAKEEQAREAEKRAKEAELELKQKDKETADLLARMHQYEKGQYGLADAVDEINRFKHQIGIRDRQIESLVQHCNKCELGLNEVLTENEELRNRLGLDKRTPLDIKFRQVKQVEQESDKALNIILQNEIEKLEEERLQLKLQMRQLAQRSGQRAVALGLTAEDLVAVDQFTEELKMRKQRHAKTSEEDQLEPQIKRPREDMSLDGAVELSDVVRRHFSELEAENVQLQQGLRELREQLRDAEGGVVTPGETESRLTIPTLDKLLSILEAREFSGSTGMGTYLKAEMDELRGRNEELRSELKSARFELQVASAELYSAKKQCSKTEEDLKISENARNAALSLPKIDLPENTSSSTVAIITNLSEHLVFALHENAVSQEKQKKLEKETDELREKYQNVKHQQESLYEEYASERKELEERMLQSQTELATMSETFTIGQTKLEEFDRLLDNLSVDDIELRQRLSELTRKFTASRINEQILIRKYNALLEIEKQLRTEKEKFEREALSGRTLLLDRLNNLEIEKAKIAQQLLSLQKQLERTCSMADYEGLEKEHLSLSEKYGRLVDKEIQQAMRSQDADQREVESAQLLTENDFLKRELEVAKERLYKLELIVDVGSTLQTAGTAEVSGVQAVASKRLAMLEMKELNERQKANYAQAMYDSQREQLRRMEQRNLELEDKFEQVAKANLDFQASEALLREELSVAVSKDVHENALKLILLLENSKAELELEVEQHRKLSEVTNQQFLYLEKQISEQNIGLTEAQELIRDLQAQSDYKATIGKLHREIVHMKLAESSVGDELKIAKAKLQNAQTLLLRAEKQMGERENVIRHLRSEQAYKTSQSKRTIMALRKRFAGAVSLPEHESFLAILRDMQENQRLSQERVNTAIDREQESVLALAELRLKQESAEELISALKEATGTSSAAAGRLVNWHSRLEELRLKELRLTREVEVLQQQVKTKNDMAQSLSRATANLEERLVMQTKEFEQEQLNWETREADLENRIAEFSQEQRWKDNELRKFDLPANGIPDPSLPITLQLDQALTSLRQHLDTNLSLRKENDKLNAKLASLESSLKKTELELLRKEKMVVDLRQFHPSASAMTASLLEVETIATTTTAGADSGISLHDATFRKKQKILSASVETLKTRLEQKEESIAQLKQLLDDAERHTNQVRSSYNEEISKLQRQLDVQTQERIRRLKDESEQMFQGSEEKTQLEQYILRSVELEDTIGEQQKTISLLTDRQRAFNEQIENLQAERSRLTDELKQLQAKLTQEQPRKPSTADGAKKPSVTGQPDVSTRGSTDSKAEAKTPQASPVKTDRSQKPLTPKPPGVNQPIRTTTALSDILSDGDQTIDGVSDSVAVEIPLPPPSDRPLTADEVLSLADAKAERSNETLKMKLEVDRLRRKLVEKNKEVKALTQALQTLRDEALAAVMPARPITTPTKRSTATTASDAAVAKLTQEVKSLKESVIPDLKAEVTVRDESISMLRAENAKLEKDLQTAESRIGAIKGSLNAKLSESENRELKSKILSLEEQLKTALVKQPAEKPLEGSFRDSVKNLELTHWEESKKQQQQIEKLKEKLSEKTKQVESQTSLYARLKEGFTRLEKEKVTLIQEHRKQIANLTRGGENGTRVGRAGKMMTPPSSSLRIAKPGSTAPRHAAVATLQAQIAKLEESLEAEMKLKESAALDLDEYKLETETLKADVAEKAAQVAKLSIEQSTLFEENQSLRASLNSLKELYGEESKATDSGDSTALSELKAIVATTKAALKTTSVVSNGSAGPMVLNRLRNELAQLREKASRFEQENADLQQELEELQQPARMSNIATVNRLHEMVHLLEEEKQQLEQELDELRFAKFDASKEQPEAKSEFERLLEENRNLKKNLHKFSTLDETQSGKLGQQKLRKSAPRVAWAEQLTSDSSRQAATKLAADNDKLRRQLRKEESDHQQVKKKLREAEVSNEKLSDELAKLQSLFANKRTWQPTPPSVSSAVSSVTVASTHLFEDKLRQELQESRRLANRLKQVEECLKLEIEEKQRALVENRHLMEKMKVMEFRPAQEMPLESSLCTLRGLKLQIIDLTVANEALKRELDVMDRQIRPAWDSSIGTMDLVTIKERLKLYDNILQENIDLKLKCNALKYASSK